MRTGYAHILYIYGGTTNTPDAGKIIGIYDLTNDTARRETLREPTQILRVRRASGTAYPGRHQYANFPGSTVEYTADIRFVRRVHGWIGARFSAQCTFVASESDFHGPLPWTIYDTRSGKKLF